jgi:hypothetical protein
VGLQLSITFALDLHKCRGAWDQKEEESHCFSSRSIVDFFRAFNLDSRSRSWFEGPSDIAKGVFSS